MKIKKVLALCLVTALVLGVIPLQASAHSNDRKYSISITSTSNSQYNGQFKNYYSSWEKKDNSTSSYVKATSGPTSFIAVIWGGRPNSECYDCTSIEYYSGSQRKAAIVRVGQKGFVRQDVYERFGGSAYTSNPVAQIFAKYYGGKGTASGVWSPDSVDESGCVDFN